MIASTNSRAEPADLDEGQREIESLRSEMEEIQAQLSLRPRPVGRVSDDEFREWRSWHGRAAATVRLKSTRYAFLKQWIKQEQARTQQRARTEQAEHENRPRVVLHAVVTSLVTVVDELIGDEVDDLSPSAQSALADLRTWLRLNGVKAIGED
jgi:hypothetical protein